MALLFDRCIKSIQVVVFSKATQFSFPMVSLPSSTISADNDRFGPLVTDFEVCNLQEATILKKNTTWAMNVWKEWATHRKKLNPANCPLYILTGD